jgi:L-fuconate dehydratase
MIDANQRWNVDEAIAWVKELAPYKPLWIEEPTSPDDILGHSKIAKVTLTSSYLLALLEPH